MKKLVLTVISACMSATAFGAFAENTTAAQEPVIRLAQGNNPASGSGSRTPSQPNESGTNANRGGMMMKDGMMMMVMPDGRMSTMRMSDKMMSEKMMREGKPMSGSMMMMMSGGKMYMMEDKAMPDGRMMSDMMMKDGMMKKDGMMNK